MKNFLQKTPSSPKGQPPETSGWLSFSLSPKDLFPEDTTPGLPFLLPKPTAHLASGVCACLLVAGALFALGLVGLRPDVPPGARELFRSYLPQLSPKAYRQVVFPASLLLVGALFSVLPDADLSGREGYEAYAFVLVFVVGTLCFLGYWVAAACYLALGLLFARGKHRSWTHRWWAAALVPFAGVMVPMAASAPESAVPYAAAALVGYASHLYLDGTLPGLSESPPAKK